MKHTKGPWKVIKSNNVNSGKQYIVDSNDEYICSINHVDMSDGAIARLIAAAPELLEALKESVQFLDELTDQPGILHEDKCTASRLLNLFTSSIVKAEGNEE